MVSFEFMTFGQKVANLRRVRGLTQKTLASQVGDLTSSAVSDWENPDKKAVPGLTVALRTARALGVPLDYLADDTVDEPLPNDSTVPGIRRIILIQRDDGWVAQIDGDPALASPDVGSSYFEALGMLVFFNPSRFGIADFRPVNMRSLDIGGGHDSGVVQE